MRALAISVLVGVQPALTHVPPKRWRSMIATDLPAPAKRAAKAGPAWPAPITMASYLRFIKRRILARKHARIGAKAASCVSPCQARCENALHQPRGGTEWPA